MGAGGSTSVEPCPAPLVSSLPAVISQRSVLSVRVSILQVETLRSRERPEGRYPHTGQVRHQTVRL